jgi:phenylacetate-CoA ligase
MTRSKPDGAYWNRAKETASRSEREAEVLALLREQLAYVYESIPLYREHYDAAGFHPRQMETLADFTRRVPVITKQMLRDDQASYPPFGRYVGKDGADIARIHGSSGTSGAPTLYAISRDDWSYIADVMGQGLYTAGVRPSDRVQLATVYSLFLGGWGALLGTERIGATAFPLGAGETERQLELMYRVGSTVLVTTPTYALHMLETAGRLGYDTVKSPLRLGLFLGEPGSSIPGTRDALEQGWGIEVRDLGSTSEMTPWATNIECENGKGMHLIQDEVWTEIVDKDDASRGLAEGESGAVIYTHLRRRSQPMIRFYSGDESHMTYEPCPCGRTYPRLPAGVYGRLDDMLIIRGANIYPSQIQRALLTVPGVGVEFRIIVDRQGALDSIAVEVEHAPDLTGAAAHAALAQQVTRKLKSDTNINFQCTVVPHGTLERFVSKAKRVVDNRPKYRPANA